MNTDYDQWLGEHGIIPIDGNYYHVWLHSFAAKLNRGYAPTVIIVGETGSGKSMAGLKIIEWLIEHDLVDMEFDADDHLVYDALPFLKYIAHEIPTPPVGEDLNDGREVFQFDEGGVNLNSKDWRSQENRSIDDVLQTMRMKNCPYIFVTPDIDNIDKQVRQEADFVISMQEPGKAWIQGVSRVRDRLGSTSWDYNFVNYSKLQQGLTGNPYWTFDMPGKGMVAEYQRKERPAKEGFIEDRIEQLEEDRDEGNSIDLSDI